MHFIITLFISALAVLISAYILPGVQITSFLTALLVAAVLAVLNAVVRPLLIVLTIPVTIFTLGLFLLVINASIILLTDRIVPGFDVDGFWWALAYSIILSFVISIFDFFIEDGERRHHRRRNRNR